MTTGAEEVTTVDKLQLCFAGEGIVGGPLTFTLTLRGRTLQGDTDDHWSSRGDDRRQPPT